jgi:predicted enzyme related to lactoylglutathione lyase
MLKIKRRNFLRGGVASLAAPWTAILQIGCSSNHHSRADSTNNPSGDPSAAEDKNTEKGNTMRIHYLEIVTPDVDASVALYSKIHGVFFSVADENLGGARTAKLANGGTLGIRAPMRHTETPVVRPYFLVHDIVKAVAAAAQSGAEIAMPPTEIPGRGKFAILIQGGIESGLWQV